MTGRLLSPTNDIAFKKILGTENHKFLLIGFLNQALNLEEQFLIKELTIRSKDLIVDVAKQKECFLDILVKDESGAQYIIELQVEKEPGFLKRIEHYAAKVYSQELIKGAKYSSLCPVITLVITNHILLPDHESHKSMHSVREHTTGKAYFFAFCHIIFELPKFTKKISELKNIEDYWCYFFKNAETSTVDEQEELTKMFPVEAKESFKTLDQFSWSAMELYFYEKRERELFDKQDNLEALIKEASTEAKLAGLTEGKAEGKAEGKDEAKLEIATAMIRRGVALDVVSEVTGLGLTELLKLKK